MCVLQGVFVALWHALGLMVITRTRGPALYRRTRESHLYNPPRREPAGGSLLLHQSLFFYSESRHLSKALKH